MISTDVLVLGAGAAGLMCAATAGYNGKSVIVVDMGKMNLANGKIEMFPEQSSEGKKITKTTEAGGILEKKQLGEKIKKLNDEGAFSKNLG